MEGDSEAHCAAEEELSERRSRAKQNRANQKKNGIAPLVAVIADREMPRDEHANVMPDMPNFLRRNSAKVTYEQAKNECEWTAVRRSAPAFDISWFLFSVMGSRLRSASHFPEPERPAACPH